MSADGIEASSFPELVRRYRVSSVPKTVVADGIEFVGASPEAVLLSHVLEAARSRRAGT